MACKIPNIDLFINALKNRTKAYEIPVTDTYDNIEERLKHTQETVVLNISPDRHYSVNNHKFTGTSASGIYRERQRKKGMIEEDKQTDTVFTEVGTSVHWFIEQLLNGEDIPLEHNEWKIDPEMKATLEGLVNKIKKYAEQRQNQIDKTLKPKFFVEQKVINAKHDRASTADLIVVFSDRSALVYDFKTRIVSKDDFNLGRFKSPEKITRKFKEWEVQLSTLAEDLKESYGVLDVIGGRVIPIPITIDRTYDPKTKTFSLNSKTITQMDTPFKTGSQIKQALLLPEKVRVKNIDKFISEQYTRIRKLEATGKEIDRLEAETLRDEVAEMVLFHNYDILIKNLESLWRDYENRKDEIKLNTDGSNNPKYYTDDEITELYSKAKSAKLMLDNMHEYYSKMEKSELGKEIADRVKSSTAAFRHQLDAMISEMDVLTTKRHVAGKLGNQILDEDGNIKKQRGDGIATTHLFGLADQQNYILRAMNELKLENEIQINKKLQDFIEEWSKINNDINTWINNNGGRKALVDLVFNQKTKNLIPQLSEQFFKDRSDAIETDNLQWLKDIYEPRISEETYNQNRDMYRQKLELQGIEGDELQKKMMFYESKNNLWSNNPIEAWKNNRVVKIKDSVFSDSKYLTPEYKKILGTPVEKFYKFYKKSMYNFLYMIDRPEIAGNFVPWIRQGLIDSIMQDGINKKTFTDAFLNSISARNDSSYLSHDEFGKLEQEVPVYFLNPRTDINGNVLPGEEKSLDFMNSLLMFGKMAMTYEASKKNVGIANMLLEAYNNQMLYETDAFGKLKRVGSEYAMRPITAAEREIAEAFRDYYWYGIEMRSKDKVYNVAGRDISLIETGRVLKRWWTTNTLSFGLKQALGGYVSAKFNALIDGQKGIYYSSEQFYNASKLYHKEMSKVLALGLFMDIYTDDVVDRKVKAAGMDPMEIGKFRGKDAIRTFSDPKYAEWFRRWHYERMGMGIWKYESETRDNALVTTVAQNFGINKEGELVRFRRDYFEKDGITLKQEKKDDGYKSIYEVFKYDNKTGPQFEWDGATDEKKEKVYRKFREALKRIRSGISGEVGAEDKNYVNMTIWGQIFMHYRSWLPGVLRERFGRIRYDDRTMSVHQGRYNVMFKHLFQDDTAKDQQFTQFILGALGRMSTILLEVTYLPYAYRGLIGKEKRFQPDVERLKAEYALWIEQNPDYNGIITLEDYLEMRIGQTNAMIMELRIILSLAATLVMLMSWIKSDDDDDEYEYPLRFAYSVLRKAHSEMTFTLNPLEYTRMTKNAIPLIAIPEKIVKSAWNTYDELRDAVIGENSPYDKSGWFHYSKSFGFGLINISRIMEWTKEDMKYLQEAPWSTSF